MCDSGSAANGLQLTEYFAGPGADPVGFGAPGQLDGVKKFFLEPTMGLLCGYPSLGAPMLQFCVVGDSDICQDFYGNGISYVQDTVYAFNPFPTLLHCSVDNKQLLSCNATVNGITYDYLQLGPGMDGGQGLWFPLTLNDSASGSQYFTTGSCN